MVSWLIVADVVPMVVKRLLRAWSNEAFRAASSRAAAAALSAAAAAALSAAVGAGVACVGPVAGRLTTRRAGARLAVCFGWLTVICGRFVCPIAASPPADKASTEAPRPSAR